MKIFKIFALVLLVALVFFVLLKGGLWIEEYVDKKVYYLKSEIPKEYISVLGIDSNQIGGAETTFTNNKSVISSFEYQNKINVTAIKLKMLPSTILSQDINSYNDLTSLGIGGGVIYSGVDNQILKLSYKLDYSSVEIESIGIYFPRSRPSKYLTLNDSVCAYFIDDNYGFKITFNEDKKSYISAEVKPSSIFERSASDKTSTNMLIVFKKNGGFCYFFLLHKIDGDVEDVTEKEFMLIVDKLC